MSAHRSADTAEADTASTGQTASPSSERSGETRTLHRTAIATASSDSILSAMTAEYTAMRTEIGRLMDHEKDLFQLSFVVFGLVLAFVGGLLTAEEVNEGVATILLLVPILYLLFTLAASELTRQIKLIARYIDCELGPQAAIVVPPAVTLWQWERFKRAEWCRLNRTGHALIGAREHSRWLALTVPSIVALVAYGALVGFGSRAAILLGALDLCVLGCQILVIVRSTEAGGVGGRPGDAAINGMRSPHVSVSRRTEAS